MEPRQTYPPGVPCWIDLAPPDPDAAKRFYGGLFGWQFEERGPGGPTGPYVTAHLDGLSVAGIGSPAQSPAPATAWTTYLAVDDPDGVVERTAELGGKVVSPPVDLGVVRQAVVEDPFGAAFTVSRYQPD